MAPPRDAFRLQGKVARMTGGSSGTGRAVASIPAARDGSAEVNHRSGRAEAVVARIAQDRRRVVSVPACVTDSAAVERMFPEATEQSGRWTFLPTMPACQQRRRRRPAMSLVGSGR
jgi:NAD(P)-dependent dehydrogenase (short-subunit alcohol dehydrogenase family)